MYLPGLCTFCLCCVLIDVLVVYVPFLFGVLGRIWKSIVSVLDHYLHHVKELFSTHT